MVKFKKSPVLGLDYYFNMNKLKVKLRRNWWLTKRAYKPLYLRLYLMFTVLVNIFLFLFAWYLYQQLLGELVVLHYNVDFGIDLVGRPQQIFVLPLLGLFIWIINFSFLRKLYNHPHDRFFFHLLPLSALLANCLLALGLLSIYLINFR